MSKNKSDLNKIEAFIDIVLDISTIGTHSPSSGGATAAANAGIPDCLIKRHGRWSSDLAKDGYVKDSLSFRFCIPQDLQKVEVELFDSGLGYSGLNTARCALSSVIHLDDNKTVGSNSLTWRAMSE
ncbi:hypothetical protein ACROYT_G016067 [Oculina patagonica]